MARPAKQAPKQTAISNRHWTAGRTKNLTAKTWGLNSQKCQSCPAHRTRIDNCVQKVYLNRASKTHVTKQHCPGDEVQKSAGLRKMILEVDSKSIAVTALSASKTKQTLQHQFLVRKTNVFHYTKLENLQTCNQALDQSPLNPKSEASDTCQTDNLLD